MKKTDFLEALQEAIRTEESATVVYLKHLDAFCARFDIDKKNIDIIKKNINYLIEGNKRHKAICEGLYNKVINEDKNDY
jgi:hypothetical protein